MNAVLEFLSEHGSRLAIGATAILALGCLLVWFVRQPIHKQRVAELSVIAALLWLTLAVLPMERRAPRFVMEGSPVRHALDEGPGATTLESLSNMPALTFGNATPPLERATPTTDIVPRTIPLPKAVLPPPVVATPIEFPAAETSLEPAPAIRPWLPIAFLTSVGLTLLTLSIAVWRLRRLIRHSSTPNERAVAVWRRLDPPSVSRLLATTRDVPPMSFGVFRPTVCIPALLVDGEAASLAAVLRHELAHVRHGDALSRTMFNVALPIFALHPLYWLLRKEAVFAAELRADAAAAEPEGRESYVESLLKLFNQGSRPHRFLAASTVLASKSAFSRRMTMLLERKGELSQRTPRFLLPFMIGAAMVGAAVLADRFGVAYAQEPTKKKAVKTTAEVRFADDTDVFQTQAKTKHADARPKSTTVEFSADPTLRPSADAVRSGHSVVDALALQIADKKARLAARKYSGEANELIALPLEIEIVQLESARRSALKDYELQSVERRLLDLASESEEAAATLGRNHPDQQKAERLIAGLQKRRQMLMHMIEEEGHRTEQMIRAMAEKVVRSDALPEAPVKYAPKKASGSSDASATSKVAERKPDAFASLDVSPMARVLGDLNSGLKNMSREQLEANLRNVVNEMERLRAENAKLRRQSEPASNATLDAMRSGSNALESSMPMIRHRLRMAEAEPALWQSRLDLAETSLDRVAKLHKTGAISAEEVAKAEAALTEARAALRKAQVEIESLKTLLKELEASKATKADAFNKATGVAR
jgi:beta-lactamase regulating signal transducer with metallopeptidase domain